MALHHRINNAGIYQQSFRLTGSLGPVHQDKWRIVSGYDLSIHYHLQFIIYGVFYTFISFRDLALHKRLSFQFSSSSFIFLSYLHTVSQITCSTPSLLAFPLASLIYQILLCLAMLPTA